MRGCLLGALGLIVAGCTSGVPDSGPVAPGVGFGDYATYELERAQREATLGAAAPATLAAPTLMPLPMASATPVPPGGIAASELAAVGIGMAPVTTGAIGAPLPALGGPLPAITPAAPSAVPTSLASLPAPAIPTAIAAAPATPAVPGALPAWSPQADPLRGTGLEAQPGNAAPVLVSGAVTADGAAAGPNIVEYALAAPNARGQEWYARFAFAGQGRADRNCAAYRSADDAQRDFLANGGPDRDRRGLDPDGDGFACAWDPAPYRAAVGRG